MFGPHLILDGSQCDTQKLGDRILIEQILTDYPAAIGMTRIGGPYMFEYQAPDPAYSGVSGIVVIAESHIAIHTFPALDYFSMDIFSCKNFDHERAIAYIEAALDVKHMDRMLVQRGLSFRGPHHGANGATDDLIAAAEARLAAGIISNETVTPEEAAVARAQLIARHGSAPGAEPSPHAAPAGTGHMIWPQYGVTPDHGTYGADAAAALATSAHDEQTEPLDASAQRPADCEPCARDGARVVALDGLDSAPLDARGQPMPPSTPVHVNPTASISGLLDKLGSVGGGARALSRALSVWEDQARDPESAVALAISTPVIADGMRETLVYAIEHGYVDVVICSAADVLADVHEALGHYHYVAGGTTAAGEEDTAHTHAALAAFAAQVAAENPTRLPSGQAVLRALGNSLARMAPRKGVLQAAANAEIPVICPDLALSALGHALAKAYAGTTTPCLNPLEDVTALAHYLGARSRAGVIAVGAGPAEALVRQALTLPAAGGCALAGEVSVGVAAIEPAAGCGGDAIVVRSDATLALPLLVTSLAQRIPGARGARRPHGAPKERAATHEPALM